MTQEKLVNPTLDQLAESISAEHEACEDAVCACLEHAIRAGELLGEAKGWLDHGDWIPWVEANCSFAMRTAQAYMRVAANRGRLVDPNTQRVAHLALREALKELSGASPQKRLRPEPPGDPPRVAGWQHGDWRDHVDTLDDGSVRLVLTDPPFGMPYRSGYRQDQHETIAGDNSIDAAVSSLTGFLEAILPKTLADSHIHVFCRWGEVEERFRAAFVAAGCEVRGSLVWVKNATGMGDLDCAYAPKHERILHATLGRPKLVQRAADVLVFDRVPTDRHPTEKPVELLRHIIEATTLPGELVADPFGGVASTCVAAKEAGRSFWGCEIHEGYHAFGAERLAECSKDQAAA